MVKILLACPKIELDKENPPLKEIGLYDKLGLQDRTISINLILDGYLKLMIYEPKRMQDGFEKNKSILHSLRSHRHKIWALLSKLKGTTETPERTAFIALLQNIVDSKNNQETKQHPLYRVFSKQTSLYFEQIYLFFKSENSVIDQINKMLVLTEFINIIPSAPPMPTDEDYYNDHLARYKGC